MRHSEKMILNTIASYCRIFIHIVTGIFTTRLSLKYLGISDFGLYNLLAGTISMLSFFSGSLLFSTQRYYSVAIGAQDKERLLRLFNSSISIHLILSLGLLLLFIVLQPIFFNFILTINYNQLEAANVVYLLMIISMSLNVIIIPFSAIINAKEDLVVFSIVHVLGYLFQLFAALSLKYISIHKLEYYTLIVVISCIVQNMSIILWTRRYKEVFIKLKLLYDCCTIKELLGFTGWNTLGTLSTMSRNQGIGIVMNHFFGTSINAAYGIANQVNSLVLTFATTITAVFTPTITAAKGANQLDRMRFLGILTSKFTFLLSSCMSLPVLSFLPLLLKLWIGEVPDNTLDFSKYIIYAFLIQQLYPGICRVIYACGDIKNYQVWFSIYSLLVIPLGFLLYYVGYPSNSILWLLIISQVSVFCITGYYADKVAGIHIGKYFYELGIKTLIVYILSSTLGYMIINVYDNLLMQMLFILLVVVGYMYVFFYFVLNREEKNYIITRLSFLSKFIR